MASIFSRLGLSLTRSLAVPSRKLCERSQWWAYATHKHASDANDQGEQKYTSDYFQGLVKDKPLVVFMKGDPSAPMCGFSRLVVQILHMHGVESYPHYDVLEDWDFKEGMKKFSNWPTFPQVWMGGELVGGADIMLQMHQSGDLISELEAIGHRSAILDKHQ